MKNMFKHITIYSLAAVVFLSVALCCCLESTVQAAEHESATMSCHQTADETNSSNTSGECECEDNLAVIQDFSKADYSLVQSTVLDINQLVSNQVLVVKELLAYQAPPGVYDTSPLYIKHSVFRV